jgi:hypothetical protein
MPTFSTSSEIYTNYKHSRLFTLLLHMIILNVVSAYTKNNIRQHYNFAFKYKCNFENSGGEK